MPVILLGIIRTHKRKGDEKDREKIAGEVYIVYIILFYVYIVVIFFIDISAENY